MQLPFAAAGRISRVFAIWAALASSLLVAGCERDVPALDSAPNEVLDYRRAFTFDSSSMVNQLLIEAQSRMTLRSSTGVSRYLLLAPHPRETTFESNHPPYREMLAQSDGSSEVTFIHSLDGHVSIVSRRFERPGSVPKEVLHECRSTNHTNLKKPRDLRRDQYAPLVNTAQIRAAAQALQPIVGRLDYILGDGNRVTLDFPLRLVNINPLPAVVAGAAGKPEWQAVSSQVPLLTGDSADICANTHPAIFAFRGFSGQHAAVQLCEHVRNGVLTQDFSCPVEVEGTLQLFSLVESNLDNGAEHAQSERE